jgi:hypothetical protein
VTDADLVIPMKEHVRETVPGKAATCTESGLTDGVKCSECGEILVAQEEISALGHDFGEWKIIMKPTITRGGILRRTCKRPGCLFTEERREDATGKVGNVYTVGDCTYTITDMENLTVSLTGWNGKGTAFAVPDTVTIGGAKFTVTGIGAGAFAGNSIIEKIILGEKVEVIADGAFKDCTSLSVLNARRCVNLREIGNGIVENDEKLALVLLNVQSLEKVGTGNFTGLPENAAFALFCGDAAQLAAAQGLIQTEENGWTEGMTATGYSPDDESFEQYDKIEDGTLVINEQVVNGPNG